MGFILGFIFLGLVTGIYGTIIGVGGGFILIPVLLFLNPNENPVFITSTSLAVIFINACSGSWAYARMKRIDYKSGLTFASATIPGAILGALTTSYIPHRPFNAIFGFLMIAVSTFLGLRSSKKELTSENNQRPLSYNKKNNGIPSFNHTIGITLSFIAGFISSLLGIGGGIFHVPILIHFLKFPIHIATATSHFILAVTALTGTLVHITKGTFFYGVQRTVLLSIGVLIGAQLGARLSNRIHELWIMRGLAIAMGLVGIRILILAFQS